MRALLWKLARRYAREPDTRERGLAMMSNLRATAFPDRGRSARAKAQHRDSLGRFAEGWKR